MRNQKKKYRLFALPTTEENVRRAEKERLSRITVDYVLIYKSGKPVKDAAEITDAEAYRLTEAERRWLFDSNLALIMEESKNNVDGIMESFSKKLDALEAALEKQKQAEEGAANGG